MKSHKTVLPQNPSAAILHMIRLSQSLLTIAEKETQSLLLGDMLAFAILQYEKEKLAVQYFEASADFRKRMEEFRHVERVQLERLEKLQKDLGERSSGNNALVAKARSRAERAAAQMLEHRGIVTLEEASQKARIRFPYGSTENAAAKEAV